MLTRICIRCGEEKPVELFSRNSAYVTGDRKCKACRSDMERQRRLANRDERNLAAKERYAEVGRNVQLFRKYGLSALDYDVAYFAQGGKCAICGKFQKVLSVDHCHDTNQVRGLLCKPCNIGLGHFRNSVSNLLSAADYLLAA